MACKLSNRTVMLTRIFFMAVSFDIDVSDGLDMVLEAV